MGAPLTRSPLAPDAMPNMPPIAGIEMAVAQAGIKYAGRDDVLLMRFAEGTQVAGVLTRTQTPSAAVDWCRTQLTSGKARALLVNSGNANAFTGKRGAQAVQATATAICEQFNVRENEVFLASTGVIGEPLDAAKITAVMPKLASGLQPGGWHQAAHAIMTTDTFAKAATRTVTLDGVAVTLHGIAKGSGMIAPDMATMLAFLATDAAIASPVLQAMLSRANVLSFNSVTVDGDTSTSDTCLFFATGKAAMPTITSESDARASTFEAALTSLMIELAQLVARDGEGAQKLITVKVTGAEHDDAARRIGLCIANSPLIKTAIAGEDANWGRVVMAVGKSGEKVLRDALSIAIGGVWIAKEGERLAQYDEAPVAAHMRGRDIQIAVDIGVGNGKAEVWSCDLTHGYIAINADYRS
jgi:glutamate N-acetyltransferase/amino-acid N-acetyltransferase